MTGIVLRDYQADLIDRIRHSMRSHRRVLAQAPTGAGKTAIGSFMVDQTARKGLRSLFLVHRTELLKQTSAAFGKQGIAHGIIRAGHGFNPHFKTYVGAIQTVANRLHLIERPDLVIVDEAHHASSPSWATMLEQLNPRWIVGLSATPCRLDGKGLDGQFDDLVLGPDVADLIERGFLSPYRIYAPSTHDLTGIKTTAGDYNKGQVAAALDKPAIIGDCVHHYRELTPGRRAVVFCVSIAHAENVAAAFQAAGYPAKSVDGGMKSGEREATLAAFTRGDISVLTSCDLVSEGFDLPAIEVAISLRPTQSLSLWLQQIGRGLRTSLGKTEAIILDHVGNTMRHGLPDEPREWSLSGRPKRASKPGDTLGVKSCPSCFAIHRPADHCPACGHVYEIVARELEQRDGVLLEFDKAAAKRAAETRAAIAKHEVRSARDREALEVIARERNYKPGWVDWILNSRAQKENTGARA